MSTMNIAIVGGVVLLLLVLIKMRRDSAHDAPAPATGRGRSERRSRRRGKGRNAPPAPPEPMPLAAAGQSAAPSAGYDAPPVAEWPPAPEPSAEAWPPAEAESVAAEPAPEPVFADAPDAPASEAPVAASSFDDAAAAWPDDELVTEPGWPMPGEVDDLAWNGSGPGSMPTAPPAPSQPVAAWAEQAATAAPPSADLEWMSPEPAADEAEPAAWSAPAEPVDESPWPAEAPEEVAGIPAWEPQIEAVDEVDDDAWPPHDEGVDAEMTGELPVVAVPEEPAPGFDDMPADPFAEVDEIAFGDVDAGYAPADVPEIAFAPEPEAAPPVAPGPEAAAEPEVEFSFAPEEVPPIVTGFAAGVSPAPAADAPAPADVAWWDEEPEFVATAPEGLDDPALTGRFALGGFALQAGQHALGGVSFRSGLAEAPSAWAVAPADGVVPGTLVLSLEGAINCAPDGLEVVTDEGFAPTTEGFTVRVAATTAGPFAASGTFRVR